VTDQIIRTFDPKEVFNQRVDFHANSTALKGVTA
jgi:hypothetical protein